MDDSKKKKKPRIRNRPRNKANVLQTEPEPENPLKNEISPEIMQKSEIKEDLKCNPSGRSCKTDNNQESPSDFSETIKCIQQLIRKRLLKNSSTDATEKDKKKPQRCQESEPTSNMTVHLLDIIQNKNPPKDDKSEENDLLEEQKMLLNALQKKAESVLTKGGAELPDILLNNLQKLFQKEPLAEVVSSDDEEEEYIEYIYKPREYFIVSLCNFCKCDLLKTQLMPCSRCRLVYYCSKEHEKNDADHRQLCYGLKRVAENCDGHIFYKCSEFDNDQFRSYRIIAIRKAEAEINRSLNAMEQEILLFPRLCNNNKCREYRFQKLEDCKHCGQVFYCKDKPDHLDQNHRRWCAAFKLFKELVMFQKQFGRIEPSLPTKILKELPTNCRKTKDIFHRLNLDLKDECEYAALTQLSTAPLTAWYAIKLAGQLKEYSSITIHLIGAEIEFEVDILHKWELFFLHITPTLQELNVVFVGPELRSSRVSLESLQKTRCCRTCRKSSRTVNYYFENQFYHDYCASKNFLKPTLVCFYNAGLYRLTGYQLEDTWPETILAASNLKCPIVVTSYTEYEAPLDLSRFIHESNRRLNVILPPIANPFGSEKPERNFISEEDAPLMFKNYYSFILE